LHTAVKHLEDLLKFRVLNDGKGSMMASTPHSEEIAKSGRGVCCTTHKQNDLLCCFIIGWFAILDVAYEVGGLILKSIASYKHAQVSAKK
jgi:hypothetical protein